MLIQFSVRNFKTFKDRATLSLVASNYDKDTREDDNISNENGNNLRLLKSAVIYGANASGKSKFIEAFQFMRRFVVNSSKETQKGEKIPVEAFRLSSESENKPSEFEVIFTLKKEVFRYGFEVDKNTIVAEWLYHKPKTKETELFYRELQNFETHPKKMLKGATLVKQGLIRNNALFLSVASQFNEESASTVLSWFQGLNFISGLDEREFKNNTISKVKTTENKSKVLELLKVADLGIKDINYIEDSFEGHSDEIKKQLNQIKESMKNVDSELFSDISTSHTKFDTEKKKIGETSFSMNSDESKGTQKFFYLTGPIIDTLDNGGILIADELDSKIHPNLVCKIVSLFNSKKLNPRNAQLIFNTHDTNLLSSDLFRKDQIWFTEKDKYGEAKLYSLADFKSNAVRKNEAYEDNYIRGKYGAVPFLGLFDNLTHKNLLSKDEK
ncbi:MAG: ATP-binding protein [Chitinophagaceae bacterium]|jgi:AAA15 family ATPase/GTPase|nr:ATP-binding protein [Chitinophagaceae bacterium]